MFTKFDFVKNVINKSINLMSLNFQEEESYVCIYSHRTADTILFYHLGGVDIGDVDSKALKIEVPVGHNVDINEIEKVLLTEMPASKKKSVISISRCFCN